MKGHRIDTWFLGSAIVRKVFLPSAIRRGRTSTVPTWLVDVPGSIGDTCRCGKAINRGETLGVFSDGHGLRVRFMRKRDAMTFAQAHR